LTQAPTNLGDRIASWDDLYALRGREVHVVGAGSVEGAHLLLFLASRGFKHLVGHDFSTPDLFPRAFKRVHVGWPMSERDRMLEELLGAVRMRYRDEYLDGIAAAEAIGVTQGWYLYDRNRQLAKSAELQERFFSLVQLYLGLSPGPVVGVSGSQGKSTTTRLLRDILVADGRDVIYSGNDRHGRQALGQLERASATTHLVLEISNRHLKMLHRSPHVAVLTNVYPNHLQEHGGWDGYVEAKSGLLRYQKEGDIAVLNADLEVMKTIEGVTAAVTYWFGESLSDVADRPGWRERGVVVEDHALRTIGSWGEPARSFSMPTADIPLAGRHNALNVAAAACAALAIDVAPTAITTAVQDFKGLKHRIQFIWSSDGVQYYDDLNSTTPTASEVAMRTLRSDVVWIFGGEDKGLDSKSLARTAKGIVRTAIALPGGGTEAIIANLLEEGIDVERVDDFGAAVRRAVMVAGDGDNVLLSPACPGFFTLYYVGADEDTGFKKLVRGATLPTSPPARKPRT
jgi:UDP-N-acetylmuramoylalanine--D-glutamate ligase